MKPRAPVDRAAPRHARAGRAAGALLVRGAFAERRAKGPAVARALGEELRRLARWLALDVIKVGPRGDLAAGLRRAL